jgi:tetratricopeptide (TPR) repeat protein
LGTPNSVPRLRKYQYLQALSSLRIYSVSFILLLVGVAFESRSLSLAGPQELADHAYGELWQGRDAQALALFRGALERDAAFPYRWADLGEALSATDADHQARARYCFERAMKMAPRSPQIALRASNYYLRIGDLESGLAATGEVVRITSAYDSIVFSEWLRLGGSPSDVLNRAAARNVRAARAFLGYLIGNNSPSVSDVWDWLVARRYADRADALAITAWLMRNRQDSKALDVWNAWLPAEAGYEAGNRIYNPGFEREPSGTGFDWSIAPMTGMTERLDPAISHSGRSSLRFDFNGSGNPDVVLLSQHVWIPAGRYRLSGWVRTRNIAGDRGFTMSLLGASTGEIAGDRDWTRIDAIVDVRGSGAAGEVQFVRHRSWRFDGNLAGTVWLDDVELRRIGAPD